MKLNKEYNGISFNVDIRDSDRFCIFLSPSGTGKTFLFSALLEYLKEEDIGCVLINADTLNNLTSDLNLLEGICLQENIKVVILDNADLYLRQSFIDNLLLSDKTVIVSLKDIKYLSFKNKGFYMVKYEGNTLNVRRKL